MGNMIKITDYIEVTPSSADYLLLNQNGNNKKTTVEKLLSDVNISLSENTQQIANLQTTKVTKGSPSELAISYINSLVNHGSYKNTYYKNDLNEVTIVASYTKGGITDDIANSTKLFTLPIGYRPYTAIWASAQILTYASGTLMGNVSISTNGDVYGFVPINEPYYRGTFAIHFLGGN